MEFKTTNFVLFKNLVTEKLSDISEIQEINDIIEIIIDSKNVSTKETSKLVREDSYSWITSEILNLMEARDILYRKKEREPRNTFILNKLKRTSKLIKTKIKFEKSRNFQNKLGRASSDPRKLWSVINDEIKGQKNKQTINQIKTNDK